MPQKGEKLTTKAKKDILRIHNINKPLNEKLILHMKIVQDEKENLNKTIKNFNPKQMQKYK